MENRTPPRRISQRVTAALNSAGESLITLAQATDTTPAELSDRLRNGDPTWFQLVAAGGLSRTHPSQFMEEAA